VTRAVVTLLLVFGPFAVGPVAATSKFTQRLRAAAEPDQGLGESEDEPDPGDRQDDEGLGDPGVEPPSPDGEGAPPDEGEDGEGERPAPHAVPRAPERGPTPPPGQKPADPGSAEPARAIVPVEPVE
jgi:hypothetical protein